MADEETKKEEGAPEEPAAPTLEDILKDDRVGTVTAKFPGAFAHAFTFADEITLVVAREQIREICAAFKDDGYTYLVDLCGADYSKYPDHPAETRFCVNYLLYSFDRNVRVRLKVFVAEDVSVPSVTSVWRTANWHERETWDMFGVPFEGHPDLERILMWEGFNGYPLRKDFPIRGIDTGARIYPEVFGPGQGPQKDSTGKPVDDVNRWDGPAVPYGRSPIAESPKAIEKAPDEGEPDA
jgi:NADH-quinone oxidoreductase subunit C